MKIIIASTLVNSFVSTATSVAVHIKAEMGDNSQSPSDTLPSFSNMPEIKTKGVSVTRDSDNVTIDINDEYVEDVLDVVGWGYRKAAAPILKLMKIAKEFSEKIDAVDSKWAVKETYDFSTAEEMSVKVSDDLQPGQTWTITPYGKDAKFITHPTSGKEIKVQDVKAVSPEFGEITVYDRTIVNILQIDNNTTIEQARNKVDSRVPTSLIQMFRTINDLPRFPETTQEHKDQSTKVSSE